MSMVRLQAELHQPCCNSQACAGCLSSPGKTCLKQDTAPRGKMCYGLGLRSSPKLYFTGQEPRSILTVPYHAQALHTGRAMLLVIITFCSRWLELHCQFTQAWWKVHKSHAQNSAGTRKLEVHPSVPRLRINPFPSIVGGKKEKNFYFVAMFLTEEILLFSY